MAKKVLGQHFLINQTVLKEIIRASNISPQDTVIEIGTGTGVLTRPLAEIANKVITIEKDERILELAKNNLKDKNNIIFVCQDILKFKIENLKLTRYKVAGNIPYYLTGRLLRLIMESWPKPDQLTLMLQREVAERLINPRKFSKISVFTNLYGKIRLIKSIRPGAFSPPPKVDSSIITISPYQEIPLELYQKRFQTLVVQGFASPRKYLINNLKISYPDKVLIQAFDTLHLPLQARPETLLPQTWLALYRQLPENHYNIDVAS